MKRKEILNNLNKQIISLYPNSPWSKDNVGILIPFNDNKSCNKLRIYICSDVNDKTLNYFTDNINNININTINNINNINNNICICYHPIIFNPIKRINKTITSLISNNVSVISVHTRLDREINNYFLDYLLSNIQSNNNIQYNNNIQSNNNIKTVIVNNIKNIKINENELAAMAQNFQFDIDKVFYLCKQLTGSNCAIYTKTTTKIYSNIVVGVGSYNFDTVENCVYNIVTNTNININNTNTNMNNNMNISDSIIITGELNYHTVLSLIKNNNCVILLGHYESENWYFERVFKKQVEDIISKMGIKEEDVEVVVDSSSNLYNN